MEGGGEEGGLGGGCRAGGKRGGLWGVRRACLNVTDAHAGSGGVMWGGGGGREDVVDEKWVNVLHQ